MPEDAWIELLDRHEARLEAYRALLQDDADLVAVLAQLATVTLGPPPTELGPLPPALAERLVRLTQESSEVEAALRDRWPDLRAPDEQAQA